MTARSYILGKIYSCSGWQGFEGSQAYSCEGPETRNEELWEGKGLPGILGIGIHDVLFWFPTRWNVDEEHVR